MKKHFWRMGAIGAFLILVGAGCNASYTSKPPAADETKVAEQRCETSADCAAAQTCENKVCKEIACGECQYAENRQCKNFACCSDADCSDKKASTKDSCSGDPKKCVHTPIKECLAGDNYCPAGCTNEKDADCPKVVNCGANLECLQKNVSSCIPVKGTMDIFETKFSVTASSEGNNCRTRQTAIDERLVGELAYIKGKYYDCIFTKDELKNDKTIFITTIFRVPENKCSGSYPDAQEEQYEKSTHGAELSPGDSVSENDLMIRAKSVAGSNGDAILTINGADITFKYNETKAINGYDITYTGTKLYLCNGEPCIDNSPYKIMVEYKKIK